MAHAYYEKYIASDPSKAIIAEVFGWITVHEEEESDFVHILDSLYFWKFYEDFYTIWSDITLKLLSVVVQTAYCETLFKD